MSDENLDVAQELFDAVVRGDIEGLFDTSGPTGNG